MLCEAGAFEKSRKNLAAAQAHFASALRMAPRDAKVQAEYRALGAALAERERPAAPPPPRRPDTRPDMPAVTTDDLEARAETLERQYRADPSNEGVAAQLANAFEELGRSHELVALLLARIEDAPDERREAIAREAKDRFARLEGEAERKGNASDATLYRDARANL
jgi:tetratricopeptide (TPR) repeat protein